MNIVLKMKIIENLDECMKDPDIYKAVERVVTEAVLKRLSEDGLYAQRIKEILK